MLGPIIQGERVRLAPPPSDFAEIAVRWLADPDLIRFVDVRPMSLQQEQQWLDDVARNPNTVFWTIWVGDEVIGTSGIHLIDWHNRHGETGSLIGEQRRREQGYGGEAMRLRTRYAFDELNLEKLTATARADNLRSIRGLKRAGYTDAGILRRHLFREGRWQDMWLGELIRDEWESSIQHSALRRVSNGSDSLATPPM